MHACSTDSPSAQRLRIATAVLLVLLPLMLGGAHPWVNALFAVGFVLLFGIGLLLGPCRRVWPLSPPLWAAVIALAFSLVQVVALPLSWLGLVAGKTYDIVSLDQTRTTASLSLDPPATAHEALKVVCALAAGLLVVALFHRRRERQVLLRTVAVAGGMVAALGLLHALLGWSKPYNSFGYANDVLVASFINPNHLAGYLGMTSLVGLGAALDARGPLRGWLFALAVLAGAGVLLSLSRGGILSFALALLFFAALVLAARVSGRGSLQRLVILQGVLVAILALAAYLAYAQIVKEMWTLANDTGFSKTDIWRPLPQMFADYSAVGVGRGAFFAIYPHYLPMAYRVTFTHIENQWLQVLADWGLIVGPLLLGLVALSFLRLLKRATEDTALQGVASALVFLAVHNMADFNLELVSVGTTAFILLVLGERSGKRAPGSQSQSPRLVAPVILLGGLALALGVVLYPAIAYDITKDEKRLLEVLQQPPSQARQQRLNTIAGRHPADFFMPLTIAEHLLAEGMSGESSGAKAAMRWINRAMYLAPKEPQAHRLAARALWKLGARAQALLEFRLAMEVMPNLAGSISREVWGLRQSADDMRKIIPSSPHARQAMAEWLLAARHGGLVLDVLAKEPEPTRDTVILRLRALMQLQHFTEALEQLRPLAEQNQHDALIWQLYAEALDGAGHKDDALAAITEARGRIKIKLGGLLSAEIGMRMAAQDAVGARAAAQALLERSGAAAQRAHVHWVLGRTYILEKRPSMALRHFEKAKQLNAKNLGYRLFVVQARQMLGDSAGVKRELEDARREFGSTVQLEKALERATAREDERQQGLRESYYLEGLELMK